MLENPTNSSRWSTLAVLLTVSVPAAAFAQSSSSGSASLNANGLNFSVGSNIFTLGMNGAMTVPGSGSFGNTVTAPAMAITGIAQPFDSARMNWVNTMYSMECASGQALTANGNGNYSCVELSDLFGINGQIGTATLPDCPAGQLITSDGTSLSCANALPTGCPAGAVPVADGSGGWTCGICASETVSWNGAYGTCSGTLPQGLQDQEVRITGSGPGGLQGLASYQCFDNTWTQVSQGYCSPPSSPPSPPAPPGGGNDGNQ